MCKLSWANQAFLSLLPIIDKYVAENQELWTLNVHQHWNDPKLFQWEYVYDLKPSSNFFE